VKYITAYLDNNLSYVGETGDSTCVIIVIQMKPMKADGTHAIVRTHSPPSQVTMAKKFARQIRTMVHVGVSVCEHELGGARRAGESNK
jgi:hypothetical protein